MKITIEPTEHFFRTDDDVAIRLWKGESGKAVPVYAFVAAVTVQETGSEEDQAEFRAELASIPAPISKADMPAEPTPHPPAFLEGGRPEHEVDHYRPVLVWDAYHGFVVARLDPLLGIAGGRRCWILDLPYGFEFGGTQIPLEQVQLWWPLPVVQAPRGGGTPTRPAHPPDPT